MDFNCNAKCHTAIRFLCKKLRYVPAGTFLHFLIRFQEAEQQPNGLGFREALSAKTTKCSFRNTSSKATDTEYAREFSRDVFLKEHFVDFAGDDFAITRKMEKCSCRNTVENSWFTRSME
jgi:hypothetical protein